MEGEVCNARAGSGDGSATLPAAEKNVIKSGDFAQGPATESALTGARAGASALSARRACRGQNGGGVERVKHEGDVRLRHAMLGAARSIAEVPAQTDDAAARAVVRTSWRHLIRARRRSAQAH